MTIKEFRLSQKLSQPKLAKALGIGVSTVGNYETGRIKPSEKVLAKIKEVFGVDLENTAAPAPAVETTPAGETTPTVNEKAEKPAKRGRKKKDAAPAVEEAPTKKPRTRKKKAEPAAAPVDESLLQMQTNAEAAVNALFTQKVYVRVDENAAYWVRGNESGAVNLW